MTRPELTISLDYVARQFELSTSLDEKIRIAKRYMKIQSKYAKLLEDDISAGVPDHEVWRNIKGWEGLYQISNFGQVRSLRFFTIKHRARSDKMMAVLFPEQIRKLGMHGFGYKRTSLWRNGVPTHFQVHIYVAKHFIPNPNNYPQVMHMDNDASNAYFKNLRWGTQSHNIQHCVESGRWHTGEKNNKTKLSESDIPKIRKLLSDGLSSEKIGKKFNVGKYCIQCIKHNKTWKHIK